MPQTLHNPDLVKPSLSNLGPCSSGWLNSGPFNSGRFNLAPFNLAVTTLNTWFERAPQLVWNRPDSMRSVLRTIELTFMTKPSHCCVGSFGLDVRSHFSGSTRFFMVFITLALVLVGQSGCERKLAQGTPDDTVAAAFKLVRGGQAEKLPRLIYADSRELRSVLGRLEKLTGAMQELGTAVGKRFPNDVAAYSKQAEESIKNGIGEKKGAGLGSASTHTGSGGGSGTTPGTGGSTGGKPASAAAAARASGFAGLFGQRPRVAPTAGQPNALSAAPDARRREFEQMIGRIFADPFSWITSVEGRLTTQMIADDQAAVLLDGAPVPPIGLSMRRADGKWYFELPLSLPVISGYVPQTFSEWSIVGSLIRVFENTVRELTDDVKSNKVNRIEQLAEKAGEKAFVPAVMVFVAYTKEMDVRSRRERVVGEFKKKLNEWGKERRDAGDDRDVIRTFIDATVRLAVEDLDLAVRKRVADKGASLPEFSKMTRAELSGFVQGLFGPVGVKLDIESPSLTAAELADAGTKAAAWKPKRK